MKVNKSNIQSLAPLLRRAIKASQDVAIDFEMSGISAQPPINPLDKLGPLRGTLFFDDAIAENLRAACKFSPLQFGLCLTRLEHEEERDVEIEVHKEIIVRAKGEPKESNADGQESDKGPLSVLMEEDTVKAEETSRQEVRVRSLEYSLLPLDFDLFPKSIFPSASRVHPQRDITFSSDSLEFLRRTGFSMDVVIDRGLNFTRPADAELAREYWSQILSNEHPQPPKEEDAKPFLELVEEGALEWAKKVDNGDDVEEASFVLCRWHNLDWKAITTLKEYFLASFRYVNDKKSK